MSQAQEVSGFDLRTHIVDPVSGKILKHQPYRYVCSKEHGNYFVRDNKRYSPDGALIGDDDVKAPEEVLPKAANKGRVGDKSSS